MTKSSKVFTEAFMAKVAIEALAELAKRFDMQPHMITKLKKSFRNQYLKIFETHPPEENFEAERDRLFAKMGQNLSKTNS